MRVAVVVPNKDGERWLPGLLDSLAAQTRAADEVVVVDDGSRDGSVALARSRGVRVVERAAAGGFAVAVNAGLAAVRDADAVALVNTDVVLAPDWLQRMVGALDRPGVGAVACRMVRLDDPSVVDDAGDVLRRDGVCEQRGHGRPDGPRFAEAGEVWGACAGAALYRRAALDAAGGFDERFGMYLEDVDLALRLRKAGWTCRYEPAVARHAGGGAGADARRWVARNTIILVAKHFPLRWLPFVAYRQAAWLAEAARDRRLGSHLRGLGSGLRAVPAAWRARRRGVVPIEAAVPWRPWRGPRAGGHPEAPE